MLDDPRVDVVAAVVPQQPVVRVERLVEGRRGIGIKLVDEFLEAGVPLVTLGLVQNDGDRRREGRGAIRGRERGGARGAAAATLRVSVESPDPGAPCTLDLRRKLVTSPNDE